MKQEFEREKILIVDDDTAITDVVKDYLILSGYQVISCDNPKTGLEVMEKEKGRLRFVIVDYKMPGMMGDEFAQQAQNVDPDVPIGMIAGQAEAWTKEQKEEIYRKGVVCILPKPFKLTELAECIQQSKEQLSSRDNVA